MRAARGFIASAVELRGLAKSCEDHGLVAYFKGEDGGNVSIKLGTPEQIDAMIDAPPTDAEVEAAISGGPGTPAPNDEDRVEAELGTPEEQGK